MKATVKKTNHACPFGLYHALLYLLATAAAILLCVCAERAEERYYLKWDVSATRVSSLSDYTLAQLENLAQPVTIYPVYTAGSTLSLKDLQTETLLRMRLASSLVEVETIDPVAQPQRLQELARGHGGCGGRHSLCPQCSRNPGDSPERGGFSVFPAH